MKYKLTEHGKEKIDLYIMSCRKERKEILAKGIDTANSIKIPSRKEILDDMNEGSYIEFDGNYSHNWKITDNYESKECLYLESGADFYDSEGTTSICLTVRKIVTGKGYFEATPKEMEMLDNGVNPFFNEAKKLCTVKNGNVEYDFTITGEFNDSFIYGGDV